MRALLIGDIHLSDRPPSSCTDDYLEDLFVILEHTVDKVRELGVDAVVWSGDVFHYKQPSRTSHATVQRAIDIIQSYPVPVYIVPGNHDMVNDRFDSIAATQPLGVLFKTGATLLNGWESENEFPIFGVPWQQHWTDDTVSEALALYRSRASEGSLVIAHAPLYPKGQELEWENYPIDKWAAYQSTGYCFYGHVHDNHGIYKVSPVTFCNLGAITRGSLHESELTREIRVALWDSSEGFTALSVPHKPADQVFRLMEKRELQNTQARLDEFLESVNEASIEITSVESVMRHIRSLGLGLELEKLIEELLSDV